MVFNSSKNYEKQDQLIVLFLFMSIKFAKMFG